MPTAAIVGAGLIGRAWAMVFARAGWAVRLDDPQRRGARRRAGPDRQALDDLKTHGLVDDPAAAAARVTPAASLAEAVDGADLVQENGPETVEAKRAIFAELDALAPPRRDPRLLDVGHPPRRAFTEELPGRARCLVGHPVNPPHLVPVVELVRRALDRARDDRARAASSTRTPGRRRSW